MKKHPFVTEHVKSLLLNPDFLELVFGAPLEHPTASSRLSVSSSKYTKSSEISFPEYTASEISQAKYILLHMDEDWGLASDEDIRELRNRIICRLKW